MTYKELDKIILNKYRPIIKALCSIKRLQLITPAIADRYYNTMSEQIMEPSRLYIQHPKSQYSFGLQGILRNVRKVYNVSESEKKMIEKNWKPAWANLIAQYEHTNEFSTSMVIHTIEKSSKKSDKDSFLIYLEPKISEYVSADTLDKFKDLL